jgi:hypothetical protein
VCRMTFATAAAEWLRYVEHDRAAKPSTLRDFRSGLRHHLLPAFGERRSGPRGGLALSRPAEVLTR